MDGFKLYLNSMPKVKIVIDPYLRKRFSRSVCGCAINASDSDTNTSSFLHSGFTEFPWPWHITVYFEHKDFSSDSMSYSAGKQYRVSAYWVCVCLSIKKAENPASLGIRLL